MDKKPSDQSTGAPKLPVSTSIILDHIVRDAFNALVEHFKPDELKHGEVPPATHPNYQDGDPFRSNGPLAPSSLVAHTLASAKALKVLQNYAHAETAQYESRPQIQQILETLETQAKQSLREIHVDPLALVRDEIEKHANGDGKALSGVNLATANRMVKGR